MLTSAQQKLVNIWEKHTDCEFVEKDVGRTLDTMIEGGHVINIPTMMSGFQLDGIRKFYTSSFVPFIPDDMQVILVSRTVGTAQLVDEMVLKFTHDVQMDWILPGIQATGKPVEVAMIAVIEFRENKVFKEHIYWDQATVLVQLGLLSQDNLPVTGVESARHLLSSVGIKSSELS